MCSQSVNDVVAETQRGGGPSKGIFCVDEIVLFSLNTHGSLPSPLKHIHYETHIHSQVYYTQMLFLPYNLCVYGKGGYYLSCWLVQQGQGTDDNGKKSISVV